MDQVIMFLNKRFLFGIFFSVALFFAIRPAFGQRLVSSEIDTSNSIARPLTQNDLSYYITTGRHIYRRFPTSHIYVSDQTGNDTIVRILGYAERFSSPYPVTYLDSVSIRMALTAFDSVAGNSLEVLVTGSQHTANGIYANLQDVRARVVYDPRTTALNNGIWLSVALPHVAVDSDFFVGLITTDSIETDTRLWIQTDSLLFPNLVPRDENRDRGRAIGVGSQYYMAGLLFPDESSGRWYCNPMMVAQVSDTKASVTSMSSSGFSISAPNPNPASTTIAVHYALPNNRLVTITVFDARGSIVLFQNENIQSAGNHRATLDLSSLPSGSYSYRVVAGEENLSGRLEVLH
ncbi:MAG TPA: T9SS type A sorting domain-containing protein [Candidatus Kapabacteria bacterium]|jgi:ribosomal protein S11|nr:T9SS type A sorting domain-containing protein [Candidatus Kapabacteria bacterium]